MKENVREELRMAQERESRSLWSAFGEKTRNEFRDAMRVRRVARGETLIEKDAPADALFIVNFGLFEVLSADNSYVAAEIGVGQLIGEIGFFAGEPRTASVVAARDSEVLEISRAEFNELTMRFPEIHSAVIRALALRLAELAPIARNSKTGRQLGKLRVATLIGAGSHAIPQAFVETLRRTISNRVHCCLLTAADASARFGGQEIDRYSTANWLADMERSHDLVICIADATLTDWTQIALRSADQVLFIAHGSPKALSPVETLALQLFPMARRRMIRLHSVRSGYARPGADWLRDRDVFMAHQVSMQDEQDFHSLSRFLSGQAIGFVAGGGGAFGPAHIGIYKAFIEQGIVFDIHGGSSVGAAMTAAFSLLKKPDEIQSAVQQMFVVRRALKRFTFPRYGLLDHKVFDSELRQKYGLGAIEDLWKPWFAIATDLSNLSMRVLRKGPLWEAIRASCSVPGVLPPFFDDQGHMLVDGGVTENLPVAVMHSIKTGPNLVVDLRPRHRLAFDLNYAEIPGRRELLGQAINALTRKRGLPPCPDPATVIMLSVFDSVVDRPNPTDPLDLVFRLPPFPGSSDLNWDRHADVIHAAYEWGRAEINKLRREGHPAIVAMERVSQAKH
jgi:NTE family protein